MNSAGVWFLVWLGLGLLGHVALGVAFFNRTHAAALPRWFIKLSEKLQVLAVIGIGAGWIARLLGQGVSSHPIDAWRSGRLVEGAYFFVACQFLFWIVACWLAGRWRSKRPTAWIGFAERRFDVERELETPLIRGVISRTLSWIPGNETTQLCVNEKTFELENLNPRHDELSIAHLSDLHFTGKLARSYFDFVVDRTNELDSDLIVITGDIVDKRQCLDWIGSTLGRLRAKCGVYFILGNHDLRVRDIAGLRQTLTEAGLIDIGGRYEMLQVDDRALLIAGNERPWFGPAPRLPRREMDADGLPIFRLLLSHSPDQIGWARRNDIDLLLAGHTHGGQIRFPVIGPVVAPSSYGVQYASGVFYEPPTLMHVSRGISGLDLIRLNCPPELTRIVLRCATSRSCDDRFAEESRDLQRV